MSLNIAYLAQGKLYLKQGNKAVREIESEFGQSVQERRLQIERRQAMRNRGIQNMMGPSSAQMAEQPSEAVVPIAITSICRLEQGKLIYSLESAELGGLFSYDPVNQSEQRLFHNTEFHVGDLDFNPKHHLLTCTKTYPTGIANIATLDPSSHRPHDLTEGDSVDSAPRWIRHKEKALIYQSAGVRRDSQGFVIDRAPMAIVELDFKQQDTVTVVEDPKFDLLGPQSTAEGWIYYIRRPYKSFRGGFNLKQLLKDLVLLPFRLAYSFFQLFNVFSQMMTGKPLINAATRKPQERQPIRTLGGLFLPENLPKKHAGEADAPALVPATWQLVRQGVDGEPEVLAEHVLSYDLAEDGSVVYTNGSGIYRIE
ncbi:MAG: hypothetical protein AAF704_14795, partial [Cyanobacteria bacterium P01_D01_bin.123]